MTTGLHVKDASDAADIYAVLAHLADLAIARANTAEEMQQTNAAGAWLVLCEMLETAEAHAAKMVGADPREMN